MDQANDKPSERGRRGQPLRRATGAALVILILAATAGAVTAVHAARSAADSRAAATLTEPILPVSVLPLHIEARHAVTRHFGGLVTMRRDTEIAFQIGGLVTEIARDIGDRVASGEVLARLDIRRLDAAQARIAAQLAEAEAQAELAAQSLARQERLVASNATTRQALDEAQAAHDRATAMVAALAAERAALEIDRDDSALRAPFDGVVVARRVEIGAVAQAGAPAFRLIEIDAPEAEIGVPADIAEGFAIGQRIWLRWRDERLPASIRAVVPQIGGATRTATLVATLAPGRAIAAGETVELAVETDVAGAGAWVPRSALVADARGLWALYVARPVEGGGHRIVRASVELLHLDGERAFVAGTVEDGALVLADGTHRVLPGRAVAPVTDPIASRD